MPGKQIVIVDEDRAFLELIDMLLTTHGYATIRCAQAQDAYNMIRSTMPALVILGIRDAGDDANWTVLDMIRLDPATTHIPALVCSIDSAFLRAKAPYFELLDIATLEKPFRLNDLLMKVEREIGPPTP
jgi:CheY-like chemotaxis protein